MPLRVLIVEDNGMARQMIARMVLTGGHEVVAESQGLQDTLKAYRSSKPDVVTLDLSLGQAVDGLKVLKALMKLDSEAKVVVVSANIQEKTQNLLLASGWWGLARHFHYVPEIVAALCWTLPALLTNLLPYGYVVFLTALLLDRAFRQERRCKTKYGDSWSDYCEKVPYKVLPFFF